MVSWRCPHCGTPQQEAARCWVCHRSTTSCSTCRHFRQGVTARLGYCALDRGRAVLTGAEERACWQRSTRETVPTSRSSRGGEPIPVVPWAEPEPTDGAEFEREIAPSGQSGAAYERPAPVVQRLGLRLLDDEVEPFDEPVEFGPARAEPPSARPSDDLWSLYLAGPSPVLEHRREASDTSLRSAGMWVESTRSAPAMPPPQAPLTARHRNARSVRHRPWGPVPGREDTYLRSLRVPEKVRRPGL